MARWLVTVVENEVRLTYFEAVDFERMAPKSCGSADLGLLHDILHFAADQSSPWDLLTTPDGEFVRLLAPVAKV